MLDFLKTLFRRKDETITLLLFEEEASDASQTFQLQPQKLLGLLTGALAVAMLIVSLLYMFTPLGSLLYNEKDNEIHESVVKLGTKLKALKDSLDVRDSQLNDIKQVLLLGADTTFNVSGNTDMAEASRPSARQEPMAREIADAPYDDYEVISKNQMVFSRILNKAPSFPAPYPVKGTQTRGYQAENGHYGIDIAATQNEAVHAVADGAVINKTWTVSYGYVMYIQHSGGFISVYKHCNELLKDEGDIVVRGEVIGTVGNTGVLSSGPHLHFELWKNGIPLNPNMYLEKF